MRSCIIVYDGVNILDFARIYDIFVKCGIEFVVIGFRGDATDEMGLKLPMHISSESLYGYDIVANAKDRLSAYKERCEKKGLIGIPTGIPQLDDITNGVKDSMS